MAAVPQYSSQDKVEGYLGRSMSDEEASIFVMLENGVADFIDNYCGRSFSLARSTTNIVDATTGDGSAHSFQRYDGGQVEMFFDEPLQTDTTLDASIFAPYVGYIDTSTGQWTLIDPKDYILYPLNHKVKTSIQRFLGIFPYGVANIFVYGKFCDFVTPPQAIVAAVTTICANFYNMTDDLKSETIEGYARVMDKDWNPLVQKILDDYRRVIL